MNLPEVELPELLRSHGKEALYRVAEEKCLRVGDRLKCPFEGCRDHGADRPANVVVFAAKDCYRVKCFRCEHSGTLIDLLMAVRGWTTAEAIAHLRGLATPASRPPLQLVPTPPAENPEKLSTQEVQRVWNALATEDVSGSAYLEQRQLHPGELVRYAHEKHPDQKVKVNARQGRRIGMLLRDVVGNAKGIQFRLVREPTSREPKIMSLKGSTTQGTFFGQPELIEGAPLICVTEGMADTLSVRDWAPKEVPVVGAPGKGGLAKLADELDRAGIPIDGKLFALFVQNDRPKNESRREFVLLSQRLALRGGHAVIITTPDDWKDVAAWRQVQGDAAWPPAELARAIGAEPGQSAGDAQLKLPIGAAVALPSHFKVERYGQDFSTLLALLDDPVHREAIMGRGELRQSEMTGDVCLGTKPLRGTDLSAIRYGLEQQGRSIEGKPLKFTSTEVASALELLGSRHRFHPLTDWVKGLKWDGVERLSVTLPRALGQELDGLSAHLMRKWFLSAAARALKPGCKVDTVMVLLGPQGCGKSRFCRAVGGEYFTDAAVKVDDDNGKRVMRSSWIIEWAELTSMRRARDAEAIKSFLSQQVDVYRPLWKEQLVEAPRHCVIVGTTNDEQFLHDPTGSRRFWPVRVKGVDVAWVTEHREQLMAEAAALVGRGEQWWLEPEYESVLAEHNADYQAEDDWAPMIRDWLKRRPAYDEVTTGQVLVEVIKKDPERWSVADQRRVAEALEGLGWKYGRKRDANGTRSRVYRAPSRHPDPA